MRAAHWHAQVEVNYVVSGSLTYQIRSCSVHLDKGAVALFWGGMPHRLLDTGDFSIYHVVHLPLFHFFRLRLSDRTQQRLMQGAAFVTRDVHLDDEIAFERRYAALTSGDAARAGHAIDDLLLRIERMEFEPHELIGLDNSRPFETTLTDQPDFQSMRKMCDFIAENFRNEIHSSDIALSADIHPKYAMSVFKKSTGMTLGEYITLLRLSYAQALLLDESVSVLQVAMESGFGSLSAFNKCFRRKAGMTPSEFKRELASRGPLLV